ncbi:hypothetical protein ABHA52_10580 [Enterococcus faecium]|uniref:hypothetical protein n=1 Tax=Enterococcus faecium TaxID=1352 RepID=UPI0011064C3B|nr:hypothetical protein [Enterococcus faecium]MDB7484792.1 hypothetical protein [Enterococcus faecium]MDB7489814.1 hypothetical protein [Enterococcus faecium]MDB7492408.1 hypothetical protein [Enterococcus faecium]MDB7495020.1 hypothetical protein [Enterococcus faecium]MDB7497480.1 hypothetical protein [Enterococcus faecium]
MIKDSRKTKENSKKQEQYINYIKEYFAEAPIEITNDKTKLYITHNNYPISLENTSIIEKFTNKNKGIEFTREQAIKEAERLRNELAVEVKNYKAMEIVKMVDKLNTDIPVIYEPILSSMKDILNKGNLEVVESEHIYPKFKVLDEEVVLDFKIVVRDINNSGEVEEVYYSNFYDNHYKGNLTMDISEFNYEETKDLLVELFDKLPDLCEYYISY